MSRTIVSAETDAFLDEAVSRALAKVPDGPLEKLSKLIDWEAFREPLLLAWTWSAEEGQPGRPS